MITKRQIESITFFSEILKENRTINISVPKGFKQDEEYPTLYMIDGGMNETFPFVLDKLNHLTQNNDIPPHILIGIENTNRNLNVTPATSSEKDKERVPEYGGSNDFRFFLKKELIALIETKFKTNGQKAVLGESLGGLFVLETFLYESELYDVYIAFDPSLWWDNHSLITQSQNLIESTYHKSKKLWFGTSKVKSISTYTHQLEYILAESQSSNLKWSHEVFPKENHFTILKVGLENALKWCLSNKK